MNQATQDMGGDVPIEAVMRHELARGDRALAGVAPVLAHLLASPGEALVSDDIVARMRGMLSDLAGQLLDAEARATDHVRDDGEDARERLAGKLAAQTPLLSHCYAMAMEGLLTARIAQSSEIDAVLPPAMQALVASADEAQAELAMAAMSAQARFMQAQRRMDLPLGELPADLFHETVMTWSRFARPAGQEVQFAGEAAMRADYDESAGRLGLYSRLVASLGEERDRALDLMEAGFALFATALARVTRQPRELVVLACHERQVARLALCLRAAGLGDADVTRQFFTIHPDIALPAGFAALSKDEARSLLAGSGAEGEG